jgi:hypothetical protein
MVNAHTLEDDEFAVDCDYAAPEEDQHGYVEWQPAAASVGCTVAAHLDEYAWESLENRELGGHHRRIRPLWGQWGRGRMVRWPRPLRPSSRVPQDLVGSAQRKASPVPTEALRALSPAFPPGSIYSGGCVAKARPATRGSHDR